MVYVCRQPLETPTGRLVGVAHIQRLLREPPSTLAAAALDKDLDALPPEADASTRWRAYLATYNLVAAPVVDDEGRLLGAVTVDDLLDHMLPENWRDQTGPAAAGGGPWLSRAATASTPRPTYVARWSGGRRTTRTRSASSPSSSPGSWAPPGSWPT